MSSRRCKLVAIYNAISLQRLEALISETLVASSHDPAQIFLSVISPRHALFFHDHGISLSSRHALAEGSQHVSALNDRVFLFLRSSADGFEDEVEGTRHL